MSLDGSTLDVADEQANDTAFGRPVAQAGAKVPFPRYASSRLVENGTHVLFGTQMAGYGTSEMALAQGVLPWLGHRDAVPGGPLFLRLRILAPSPGYRGRTSLEDQEKLAVALRAASGRRFVPEPHLPIQEDRRRNTNGVVVRVIDYQLEGVAGAEPIYRLVTTILDPEKAPAPELAALYHERWEIETALDELKTHLRGARIVLRSKRPDLVRQEFYGLLMAHFAIRGLMHEAALKADEDPDRLSFVHAVRVIRRKLPSFPAIPPRGEGSVP